ncbi:MAG: Holliday junction resolvase RecU [Bacillaceae bacterium]
MTIKYPNGKKYQIKTNLQPSKNKHIDFSNRGMTLEEDLNETNAYYLSRGLACIHKKPTPIQIVKVDYPKRSAAVIKEAYFKQASTTDYNGVYSGMYLDFEAKETKNKTSFPLQNFHQHQINHMEAVLNQHGIAFVIIKFSSTDEIFLLEAMVVINYWKRHLAGERKSIPKQEIERLGYTIPKGYQPRLDYLPIIDVLVAKMKG